MPVETPFQILNQCKLLVACRSDDAVQAASLLVGLDPLWRDPSTGRDALSESLEHGSARCAHLLWSLGPLDRPAPDGHGLLDWARESALDHPAIRDMLGDRIALAERAILECSTPAARAGRGSVRL